MKPRLSTTLSALAALIAIGPCLHAATIAAEKVAKASGKDAMAPATRGESLW